MLGRHDPDNKTGQENDRILSLRSRISKLKKKKSNPKWTKTNAMTKWNLFQVVHGGVNI